MSVVSRRRVFRDGVMSDLEPSERVYRRRSRCEPCRVSRQSKSNSFEQQINGFQRANHATTACGLS
jgi:hypothetical protein